MRSTRVTRLRRWQRCLDDLAEKAFLGALRLALAENEVALQIAEIQGVDLRNHPQLLEKITFEICGFVPGKEPRLEDAGGQRDAVLCLPQVAGGVFPGFVDHVLQQFMGVVVQCPVGGITLRGQDGKDGNDLHQDQQTEQAEEQPVLLPQGFGEILPRGRHAVAVVGIRGSRAGGQGCAPVSLPEADGSVNRLLSMKSDALAQSLR